MGRGKSLKRACMLAACTTAMAITGQSLAVDFPEVEPNDGKFAANPVGPMVAGDTISGTSTGTSTTVAGVGSADNFLVSFPAAPLGIYRNRLVLTSPQLFQTGTIRGLSVAAANAPADTLPGIPWDGVSATPTAGSDAVLQTTSTLSTPPRYNQFYTFGHPTQMYYRVTGTTSTTSPYTATLETQPVTPVNIGAYVPGQISISTFAQGHGTDTDFWVYDSNFSAIPGSGNDDEGPLGGSPGTGATLQGWLSRNYGVGTYYLAMGRFNLANHHGSPSDDDFRTGSVMDFANVLSSSQASTLAATMTFTIADSAGTTLQVVNSYQATHDINWFVFTVVPEPGALALLTLALPLMMRRRS